MLKSKWAERSRNQQTGSRETNNNWLDKVLLTLFDCHRNSARSFVRNLFSPRRWPRGPAMEHLQCVHDEICAWLALDVLGAAFLRGWLDSLIIGKCVYAAAAAAACFFPPPLPKSRIFLLTLHDHVYVVFVILNYEYSWDYLSILFRSFALCCCSQTSSSTRTHSTWIYTRARPKLSKIGYKFDYATLLQPGEDGEFREPVSGQNALFYSAINWMKWSGSPARLVVESLGTLQTNLVARIISAQRCSLH